MGGLKGLRAIDQFPALARGMFDDGGFVMVALALDDIILPKDVLARQLQNSFDDLARLDRTFLPIVRGVYQHL
jgi:hypothetical protein